MKRELENVGMPRRYQALQRKLQRILQRHPLADPENIWHTLLLLELPPIERLRRGLVRGQIIASKKAANRPKDKLSLPVLQDALLATHTRQKRKPLRIRRKE
jgi:hypothetical protein